MSFPRYGKLYYFKMSAPSTTLFKKTPIKPLPRSADVANSKDSAYWNSFDVSVGLSSGRDIFSYLSANCMI